MPAWAAPSHSAAASSSVVRAERSLAEGCLGVGPPGTGLGEASEGLADRAAVARREDLGLEGGTAEAATAFGSRAVPPVPHGDSIGATALCLGVGHPATHVALARQASKLGSTHAAVLKTVVPGETGTEGSNPSPSADDSESPGNEQDSRRCRRTRCAGALGSA